MKEIKKIYYSGDVNFTKDIQDNVEQFNLKVQFEHCCEDICGYFDRYIDIWNEEFCDSEDKYEEYINEVFASFVRGYSISCPDEMGIVICVENGNCIYAYPKNDKENKIFYDRWFYHKEENEIENVIENENEETGENKKLLRYVMISTIGAVLLPTPGQIITSIMCVRDYIKRSKGD